MSQQPIPYYAALDLGSNSFHLLVVRFSDGGIQEVDEIKHMVRLGEGLGNDGRLDQASIERALCALSEMRQRIARIPREQVRVVGTNTIRIAKNRTEFLSAAERALDANIEIISGTEEARLIYLGITEHNNFKGDNLVIDIGGGSTEVIVGHGEAPHILRSLSVGCANIAKRFFSRGKITRQAIKKARIHVGTIIEPHLHDISIHTWQRTILSSGTAKAVSRVLLRQGWSNGEVTRENLDKLLSSLVHIGEIEKLPVRLNINPERAFGFVGGVSILASLFHYLHIQKADVSQAALREGVLLDLIGRIRPRHMTHDVRKNTIAAMQQRFNIDKNQASRVRCLAQHINTHLPAITAARFADLLEFASDLHEIGLAVALSKHHLHGEYLVRNADMPGFSQTTQHMMAVILRGQRKRLPIKQIEALPKQYQAMTWQFTLALRLAVLLHRAREDISPADYPSVTFLENTLTLSFTEAFLDSHPLTVSDLIEEQRYWSESQKLRLRFNLPCGIDWDGE